MTLNEFLQLSYAWADRQAAFILLVALLIPVAGTLLAWVGKGGRTDADGRFIASAVVAVAFLGVLLELAAISVARGVHGAGVFEANLLLLLAPIVCLAGSVLGIRMVFPLSELGSVKTAVDVGGFLLACAAVLWFLSKFRGWGIVFFGGLLQLLLLGALTLFFLWRMYRRAFRSSARSSSELALPSPAAGSTALAAGPRSTLNASLLALGVVAVSGGLLAGAWAYTSAQTPASHAADPAPLAQPGGQVFTFTDGQGVQHFVSRLEDVPEAYRAGAKPLK